MNTFNCKWKDRFDFSIRDNKYFKNKKYIILLINKFNIDLYNKLTSRVQFALIDLIILIDNKSINDLINKVYNRLDIT